MTHPIQGDRAPLWSRGMAAVLTAQFLSAMADNALLFATLALLKARLYPQWTEPLLQEPPINRARQLRQRMGKVDDLVQPGFEQVVLTRLASFFRPHRAAPGVPEKQRITKPRAESICRIPATERPIPGKYDYLPQTKRTNLSMDSEFFTADDL